MVDTSLPNAPVTLSLTPVADPERLAARWEALEARAAGSFFQSWIWTFCLAAERFPAALLLSAQIAGQDVALALFNRRGAWPGPETLWLGESGNAMLDAPFIEHNGPLLARDAPADLLARCLRMALRAANPPLLGRRLVLNGVDDAVLAAARQAGSVALRQSRPAPWVDFAALPPGGYLASLSGNTRHQLRRARKLHAATGPLTLHRAASIAEAHACLDALAVLHQRSWTGRGKPGAFANPAFTRFHRTLIARGWASDAIDLLRIGVGERVIGYLYNFRYRNRALAYQSGFDYAGLTAQHKPGLLCHLLAIEQYHAAGLTGYDFLAGGDRYKMSLANANQTLHWLHAAAPTSPAGWILRARLDR